MTNIATLGAQLVVDSIALFRSYTGLPAPVAYVAGYYAEGDGGEGTFWYNAADHSSTDNGGTIIVDGSSRRWYRLTGGQPFSPKWFGAKGDGATDDTAAVNTCISLGGGGAVWFPAGTYAISADLIIGTANTVLQAAPGTVTIEALSTASFSQALIQVQAAGCSVIGLGINGNFSAGSLASAAYSGVYWHGVSNTLIRDVTVTGVTFNGVYVNCTSGTEVTPGVTLENVKVTNVGWAGIFLTSSQKVQATDCSVTTCGYHGFALDYFSSASGSVTACNGVVVANLQVNRAAAPSHVLPGHTESGALFNIGAGTQNLSLTNSQFMDNSRITPSQDGIQLGQDATNVNNNIVINGNSVSKTSGFGIDASNGMTISNNVIVEANLTGIAIDLDVGTLLDEVNITGNRIINTIQRGGQAYGIFAQSLTAGSTFVDITINGNQVIDNRSPKLITYCLWIEFNNITWANTTITNNQFQDFLTAPVGTDMAAPVPSGIYCRDNLGLEELVVTTGTTLDATFYDGFSLQYAGATGVTNINNGWRSKTVTLQPSNGNTTLSTAGSGPGALTFSGGPSITLIDGQVVIATLAGNGQWGCFFVSGELSVVNQALMLFGDDQPLVTGVYPTFDNSPGGLAAQQLYGPTVQTVARLFGWDFERNIVALAASGNVAPIGWLFEYLYPSMGIEVWQLIPPVLTDPNNPLPQNWSIGNTLVGGAPTKVIWSNLTAAVAAYANQPGPAVWDPVFRESVVRQLASAFAVSLAGKQDTSRDLLDQAGGFIQAGAGRPD